MNRVENDGLVAKTMIDLYDTKKRLRQGVISLHLSTKESESNDEYTDKINNLLSRVGLDPVLDPKTEDAIRRQLDEYYIQSNSGYLEVWMQGFGFPVIYSENKYSEIVNEFKNKPVWTKQEDCYDIPSTNGANLSKQNLLNGGKKPKGSGIIQIHDPFENRENPVIQKYYILTRTNDDNIARGLQPSPETQQEILKIIDQPDFTKLSTKDKNLLWGYRYPIK